jgi:hypothetical protein
MRQIFRSLSILLFTASTFLYCGTNKKSPVLSNSDFIEKIIDLQIQGGRNHLIELPEIYPYLVSKIQDDRSESLIITKILERKGFKIIDWGGGNYPPLGSRIISVTLKKDNCFCVVNKIYYHTVSDTLYQWQKTLDAAIVYPY